MVHREQTVQNNIGEKEEVELEEGEKDLKTVLEIVEAERALGRMKKRKLTGDDEIVEQFF